MRVKVCRALKFGTLTSACARCSANAEATVGPIIAEALVVAHTERTTPAERPAYKAFMNLPKYVVYRRALLPDRRTVSEHAKCINSFSVALPRFISRECDYFSQECVSNVSSSPHAFPHTRIVRKRPMLDDRSAAVSYKAPNARPRQGERSWKATFR